MEKFKIFNYYVNKKLFDERDIECINKNKNINNGYEYIDVFYSHFIHKNRILYKIDCGDDYLIIAEFLASEFNYVTSFKELIKEKFKHPDPIEIHDMRNIKNFNKDNMRQFRIFNFYVDKNLFDKDDVNCIKKFTATNYNYELIYRYDIYYEDRILSIAECGNDYLISIEVTIDFDSANIVESFRKILQKYFDKKYVTKMLFQHKTPNDSMNNNKFNVEKEGIKFDDNKTKFHLLEPDFIKSMADIMTYGANKYNERNWEKLEGVRILNALCRHLNSFQQGEIVDPETNESHLAHIACNAMMLNTLINNKIK